MVILWHLHGAVGPKQMSITYKSYGLWMFITTIVILFCLNIHIYYIYSNVCPFSNPLMSILNGGISWKTNRQLPTAFRRLGWMILMPQIMPIMGIWGMKKKHLCLLYQLLMGRWLTYPSEKYESQWDGLSHILWKIYYAICLYHLVI